MWYISVVLSSCLLIPIWLGLRWYIALRKSVEQVKLDLRDKENETAQWVNTVQTEYRVSRYTQNSDFWVLSKNNKILAIRRRLSEVLKQIAF
jgi:hypothetical protein